MAIPDGRSVFARLDLRTHEVVVETSAGERVAFAMADGRIFCKDRDGYLLWDPLHPTKQVHALIGEYAIEQLPALD